MFDEEEDIINYEVESDDSIAIVKEMPEKIPVVTIDDTHPAIIIIDRKDQIDEQQSKEVNSEPLPQQPTAAMAPSVLQQREEANQAPEEEEYNMETLAGIFKKKTLKQLVKITTKCTDEEIEELELQKKKIRKNQTDDDVIFSGAINSSLANNKRFIHDREELRKQKQWQLMVNHFSNQPDFIDAALAFTELKPNSNGLQVTKPAILQQRDRQLSGRGVASGAQITTIVNPKTGLKKGPGRKKGSKVTFDDQTTVPASIEYIKTCVAPDVQRIPQAENQLIHPPNGISSTNQNSSSLIQQFQIQQSQPVAFHPPYANPNKLQVVNVSQATNLNHQQASQQSYQFKYLNMHEQLQLRSETSPTRTRDLITVQYMSNYQVEKPQPNAVSRLQPVVERQEIEKQVQYEINEKKRQERKNPQSVPPPINSLASKNEIKQKIMGESEFRAKASESQRPLPRPSIPAKQLEQSNQVNLIESDNESHLSLIEEMSQDFIKFRLGIDENQPDAAAAEPVYWKSILTLADIPASYYLANRDSANVGPYNVPTNSTPIQIFKLFFNGEITELIFQSKLLNEETFDQMIAYIIVQLLLEMQCDQLVEQSKMEHLINYQVWLRIQEEFRIEDSQLFLKIFNQNLNKYYITEEFLVLEKPIFNLPQTSSIFTLSDAQKGYISNLILFDKEDQEHRNCLLLQQLTYLTDSNNKILLNDDLVNPILFGLLKQKKIGCLGKVIERNFPSILLTKEQLDSIDNRKRPTYFLSHDELNVLLGQSIHNIFLTSFADISQTQVGKENSHLIQYFYNKLRIGNEKRKEIFTSTQMGKNKNKHLEFLILCVQTVIFNSSIIAKYLTGSKSKSTSQKAWFVEFLKQLNHEFMVRCFQIRRIKEIPQQHRFLPGQLSQCCTECAKPSTQLCQDCSNSQRLLIYVCTDDQCKRLHQQLTSLNEKKFLSEPIKGAQAIITLREYQLFIQKEKANQEIQKAKSIVEETLMDLEKLDPETCISYELQKSLAVLKQIFKPKMAQSTDSQVEIQLEEGNQSQPRNDSQPQWEKQKKTIGKLQVVKFSQQ